MLNKAIINLKTLRENALFIKKRLKKAKFFAVVKADAYGHDAVKSASAVYDMVDGFCVCLTEEAVALRNGGIDKDILVFTPVFKEEARRAVFYGLTLTVCSVKDVNILEREGRAQGKTVKVHIKYNTGMNRNGVDGVYYLKKLIKKIIESRFVKLTGVYSHFFAPENDGAREKQLKKFKKAVKIVKEYDKSVLAHISASCGFLKGVYYDAVRIGILLYGFSPFGNRIRGVKPVMAVKTFTVKKRNLKKGDRLLYGEDGLKKDACVKLVRFGYADGLPRKKIKGDLKPRCMDITAVETVKSKKKNKEFYILYKNACYLAKKYDTISYEILVGVSKRAEKEFIY